MILHTHTRGNGEPIVFLHTGLQTGLTDFEFQREYFSKDFQVLSPDLRGHGQSISNDIQYFFEDSARDLFETIEHYKLKSIHLVGCSLGALVAIKFAQLYPERLYTLTVSGITPVKPDNWLELHKEDVESQKNVMKSEEANNYFNQLHSSDWKQFILKGIDEDWYPFDDVKSMHEFDFPVLFIVGERNPHETVGATIYPKANKNVHVAIVPFAGHLVHSEQPEIYSSIVEEFMKQT